MLTENILDVLAARCEEHSFATMRSATPKEWTKALQWMDTSGVALYFLQQVEERGMTDDVPDRVLERLRENRVQNRERVADLARELGALSKSFSEAGIRFLVHKGLANVPEACPDPALRLQIDLDLMLEAAHINEAQELLKWHGYGLTAIGRGAWEFRTVSAEMPRLADLYMAKRQRSLDVHPLSNTAFEKAYVSRCEREVMGARFHALGAVDRLLAQAQHLSKHMYGEWTRLSWLIEMRAGLKYWADDAAFWSEVCSRINKDQSAAQSLATASRLCRVVLGETWSNAVLENAERALPKGVQLWIAEYGRETVLRSFPGSKLYLLIPPEAGKKNGERHRRLLPISAPPAVVPSGDGAGHHLHAFWEQMQFIVFRLRFHVREGARYLFAATRWKRLAAQLEESR